MSRKIKSVLELSRYKVGDVAWWVVIRGKPEPEITEANQWMTQTSIHPKTLYKGGPYEPLWNRKALLPKLQHQDFNTIVGLLTSDLVIEQFVVCDLVRSRDTGEFYYENERNEWMPEGQLLDTKIAAERERTRVRRLLRKWIDEE
jgi:hypothetical protein